MTIYIDQQKQTQDTASLYYNIQSIVSTTKFKMTVGLSACKQNKAA